MKTVRLTLAFCTKRGNPRFEWLKESLLQQEYKDFEFIMVDGLADQRAKEVVEFFKDVPFPMIYLRDKPNRWLGIRTALANSRNTALIFANGQQFVEFDDCSRLDRHFTEHHNMWAEQGYCVAGTWISYEKPWEEGPYGFEYRSNPKQMNIREPQPSSCDWLYGANYSVPLKAAIEVNGFDEFYCGEMGVEDCDFGIRVGRKGYRAMFDPECIVHYVVNPDDAQSKLGEKTGTKTWEPPATPLKVENTQDWAEEKKITPKERLLEDGKMHFANEWLIQLLHKQDRRFWPLGNAFRIADLRQKLAIYRPQPNGLDIFWNELQKWVLPLDYDWRDGQKLEEMRKK